MVVDRVRHKRRPNAKVDYQVVPITNLLASIYKNAVKSI